MSDADPHQNGTPPEAAADAAPPTDAPDVPMTDAADAAVPAPADAGLSDAEATLADLDVPEPEIPEPEIPDAVIPEAALAEPVIPPPSMPDPPAGLAPALPNPVPAAGSQQSSGDLPEGAPVPATRAERRTVTDAAPPVASPPIAPPREPDPQVVPPPSGATPGSYRGWTVAIFGILVLLLVGAVVVIGALLAGGVSPFPASDLGSAAPHLLL